MRPGAMQASEKRTVLVDETANIKTSGDVWETLRRAVCQKPNGQEKVLDQFREQRGRRRLCEVLGPCYCCCCQVASVMSDSMQPHRRQPTRLLRPWDSPGKNTGVGCHFLLQCMKVKSESEVAQSCPTLCDPMDCSLPGSSIHNRLHILWLSLYDIMEKTNLKGSNQIHDSWGLEVGKKWLQMAQKKIWGDRYVLHLDWSGYYTILDTCGNS